MALSPTTKHEEPAGADVLDVLIVGAGLSGIGAAWYLQRDHPTKTFAILEGRGATGGTWDLFRYPGVRSDSDVQTLGYEFKPWASEQSIAGADQILAYLREAAAEHGIAQKIRLHHKVLGASWSTAQARWQVDVERADTGERLTLRCRWLFCASGYYRYDQGFTPRFEGAEHFAGRIVHPQHWPDDLDCSGQRVVVIGSGATAVTLVPSLARTAAHVTMLQRTPTYILPTPSRDPLARLARALLPAEQAHALTRRKNIAVQRLFWRFCVRFPQAARKLIRRVNSRELPPGFPVDEHFNPPYAPWAQRLCIVPDADLFQAIRRGAASVVTDRIARFTARGIQLASGAELAADVIVTATGLNLQLLGGMAIDVDGAPVDLAKAVVFRGMMLSGVPNLSIAIGYTNATWTLKIGLLCEHLCRLLAHMDEHGHTICRAEPNDPDMPTRPLLDLGAGYVQRSLADLPRQGDRAPWLMSTNRDDDVALLRGGPVDHPELLFSTAARAP